MLRCTGSTIIWPGMIDPSSAILDSERTCVLFVLYLPEFRFRGEETLVRLADFCAVALRSRSGTAAVTPISARTASKTKIRVRNFWRPVGIRGATEYMGLLLGFKLITSVRVFNG